MKTVRREHRLWAFDAERDVALVASIERHAASGAIGLGLVSGFGLRRHGALGSSVAHDVGPVLGGDAAILQDQGPRPTPAPN